MLQSAVVVLHRRVGIRTDKLGSSEKLVCTHKTTRCYNPGGDSMNVQCLEEDLASHMAKSMYTS